MTLAWTDPPGPTTGNAFVNDLDLEVHAGGHTYQGNVFAGGQSVTGGSADPRNNVENVFLPAGLSGAFTVDVTAHQHRRRRRPGQRRRDRPGLRAGRLQRRPGDEARAHDDVSTTDRDRRRRRELRARGVVPLQRAPAKPRHRERHRRSARCSRRRPRITVSGRQLGVSEHPRDATATNTTQFRVRLSGNYTCGEPAALTLDRDHR